MMKKELIDNVKSDKTMDETEKCAKSHDRYKYKKGIDGM